jgi:hypothetical protein
VVVILPGENIVLHGPITAVDAALPIQRYLRDSENSREKTATE